MTIPLGPDEASKLKQQARALVICKLVWPFVDEQESSTEASIGVPLKTECDYRYVHVSHLGVWFFDYNSGMILAKLPLP